jgi:cyanate lyase
MAKYVSRIYLLLQDNNIKPQAKFTSEELQKLGEFLEVPTAELHATLGEHYWPRRGLGPMPPTDPVIYRLYEVSHLQIMVANF